MVQITTMRDVLFTRRHDHIHEPVKPTRTQLDLEQDKRSQFASAMPPVAGYFALPWLATAAAARATSSGSPR
jgi:hypothetical protein